MCKNKIIAFMLLFILSMQLPILNENLLAENSINALPIDATYSNPQSITLEKGDKIATTYSTSYIATETVNANQRTLLPIIQVDRDTSGEFIPLSQNTVYSVAWIDGASTTFTFESRLIENAYGIGWLEQGSVFTQDETYGFNALHSLLTAEYPNSDFIKETNENGIIDIDAGTTIERTNGGTLNLITLSLLGFVKFEGGDVDITETRYVNYTFTLPSEAQSAGNSYYAEFTWNEPDGTDVNMDLYLDSDNLVGSVNFTFNNGYFYQTREISYLGKYIRYWAIPFSVFIHYYPSSTRSLSVSSINFSPMNSIGKNVLLTKEQRIEKEFQGYKFSKVSVNKNINIDLYKISTITSSTENDQYLYNFDDIYLDRNIFAITDIMAYNGARSEITAVSLPYIIINGTSYLLTNDLMQDLKDISGTFLNSADINRGINGIIIPNLNTNSQENFYTYSGSTIDVVYSVDVALIFVKFVIYDNVVNFSVEIFTKDGNQYPMKIIQYWDVAPFGRTYYHVGTLSNEWTTENSGQVNSRTQPERYIRTVDSNDNGEITLYGDTGYVNSTGYALMNNGQITDDPGSEDDDERIRDNNTVLYYVTSTGTLSDYYANTLSYITISPSITPPEHELGITSFTVPDADINTQFDVSIKVVNNEVIRDRVGLALFIDDVFSTGVADSLNSAEEKTYTLNPIVYKSGYHNAKIEIIPLSLEDRYLSNNFAEKTFYAGVECDILSPNEGDKLEGNAKIVVSTLGPVKTTGGVQYKVGTGFWTNMDKDQGNKWSVYWNTKTISNGNYLLQVRAMTNQGTTATDSINVSVNNPPDVYDVELFTEINSKVVNPGQTASYVIKVKNVGNVPDTYDISTIGGGVLSDYAISLNPNDEKNITLDVTASTSAKDGNYYNVTVRVDSRNSNEMAELFTSTLVKDIINFGFEIRAFNKLYAGIGEKTDAFITVKNIGVNQDIANLKVVSDIENIASLETDKVLLNSQEEKRIKLTITLPSDLENNTEIIMKISATSTQDPNVKVEKQIKVIATTETTPRYNFEISTTEKEKKGYQGDFVSFIVRLKNTGNRPDNIIINVSVPQNWTSKIDNFVYLDLAETKDIVLNISISETALRKKHAITINAQSENDTNISKSAKITVDVDIKRLVIFELSVDNSTKTVKPGVSAIFLISIINKGSYEEGFTFTAVSEINVLPKSSEITILPNKKEEFDLRVATPSQEKEITVNITVKSKTDESIVKTLILTVIVSKGVDNPTEQPKEKFFIPLVNYYVMLSAIILLAIIKKRRQNHEQ